MPFRDTYWNIPDWAITLLYATQALGLIVLLGKLWLRRNMWYKGEGKLPTDRFWERLRRVFKYAVAQVRILRENYSGIMHMSIFLSLIVLFIGTALATIDYDIFVLLFDAKLLQGDFYLVYELVLDFVTLIGIFGLALALGRRATFRPNRLTYSFGFQAMLWILLIDLLSGLLIESFRLAVVQPPWQTWSFAGYAVSRLWVLFGVNEATLQTAHLATWIFHFSLTAVIYAVFLDLPLKHIIYSPLNVFFSSFREPGALRPLDLEDETVEVFGARDIQHFSVMQLLDGDACTECGRCQAACPAWMAGTPLNPKEVVLDIRRALDHYGPVLRRPGSGDGLPEMPVTREFVSEDALWACTTCRACVYECPVLIEHVDSIVDMRRYLVLMEGDMPDLLGNAMMQAERAGNPWGNPRGTRLDWASGLNVPVMAKKKKADVLYWVGCAGAYDPESQKTARAMVKIFEAAGIDYAVLGDEERCNCEWARRAGNEYLYQEATHSNIAVFDQYEFQTIVTHCPHCFNTFANEYPQFGGHYDVVHHSTYITRLINDGHLKLTKPIKELTTYHDSCYLGRYNEVYDDPRSALIQVQDIELVEMPRSRDRGLCCGGGGAQVWFETHQPRPVNEMRLEEAISTGAQSISTACPFCTIMLSSAAQSKGENIPVRDLAVVVAEALGVRSLAALALAALLLTACGGALTGPPPRPTVAVVTAEGPYFTAFDSADDWLVGGSERSSGAVIDGVYRLAIEEPGIIAWTRQTRAFGDGVYEVDAQLVSGPEASAFGLLLMGSSDLQSFVYAMITGDGRYDVGYCERACQTHESLVGGFTLSHAILVDYQPNHLRVELRNGELTFSVNGTPVATVQGIQTGKGLVGFIGESGAYAGFEASFDNLQITPSEG